MSSAGSIEPTSAARNLALWASRDPRVEVDARVGVEFERIDLTVDEHRVRQVGQLPDGLEPEVGVL